MFEHLDTALAFASIMLLLSLILTAVVQFLVSTFGVRGRNLKWALTEVLQRCDGELERDSAEHVTELVLRDPLLATSTNRFLWLLDKIIVRLRRDPTKPSFNFGRRPPVRLNAATLELAMRRLLDANWQDLEGDLSDNADLQTQVGRLLGENPAAEESQESASNENGPAQRVAHGHSAEETGNPEEKGSKLAAGLAEWFDVAMTASAERFKLRARWLTAAGALIIGVGLQVDAPEIWRRLSTDAEIRTAAAANIATLDSIYRAVMEPATSPANAVAAPTSQDADDLELQVDRLRSLGDDLDAAGVLSFSVPRSSDEVFDSLAGKLATVLLLSLGAPFWYSVLSSVIGLKGPEKKEHLTHDPEADG